MTSTHIDILLATHNGAQFVETQIESILAQSHRDWKLLVADDGSTDGTVAVIRHFERNDKRIKLVSTARRGGPAASFLYLLTHSDAEYSFLCDQDDYWAENKLQRLLDAFAEHPPETPTLIASDAHVVDGGMRITADSFLDQAKIPPGETAFNTVLVQNPVLGCTSAVNRPLREIVARAGVDPSQVIMHDWWLALAASSMGILHIIPDKLVRYRQHGENRVGAFRYSTRSLLASSRRGRAKTAAIVGQARHFRACHYVALCPSSQRVLDRFLSSFDSPAVTRPFRLARGGNLKSGLLRRVGQLAFAMDYREGRR